LHGEPRDLPIVLWFFVPALAQQVSEIRKRRRSEGYSGEVLQGEKVAINGTTDVDAKTSALTITVTHT